MPVAVPLLNGRRQQQPVDFSRAVPHRFARQNGVGMLFT